MLKKLMVSIMIIGAFSSCTKRQKVMQIKGSDTMVNIVQALAENYMSVNKGESLSVTGGGSGTGIAALENNTCDIANSSRDIKQKEKDSISKGVKEIVLGVDGLSVIVAKNNPIEKLTVEDIGKIFRGEITNWKELGGSNIEISLYGRQPNSGTYDFFREYVVKADYSKNVKEMNGSSQILEAVSRSNNASAIGYVGTGYTKSQPDSIKVIRVAKTSTQEYYLPDSDNVLSGRYPLSRPLYQYFRADMTDLVKKFIAFEISEEGQKIVTENGFFPINEAQRKNNLKLLGL
jgi:phosphate transport system substrate-binding protein